MKKKLPLSHGFTLVEMLIVIAVIAILTGLAVPAMKGLVGVSGVRGGTASLVSAFDQARFAAIESATNAYLGFPGGSFSSASNPSTRYNSFIVFRARSANDPPGDPPFKPLTRWISLPTGVLLDLSQASLIPLDSENTGGPDSESPQSILPKLDGQEVPVEVIRFDKYGRVLGGQPGMSITIGSGIVTPSTPPVFPNPLEKERFVVQRLTGRLFSESVVPD